MRAARDQEEVQEEGLLPLVALRITVLVVHLLLVLLLLVEAVELLVVQAVAAREAVTR
jgi:hypothetical protein